MSTFGVILSFVCLFDLSFTLCGIFLGVIIEQSLTLSWYYFNYGLLGLISVKLFMNISSVFLLEINRRKIPANSFKFYYLSTFASYAFYFFGGSFYYTFAP